MKMYTTFTLSLLCLGTVVFLSSCAWRTQLREALSPQANLSPARPKALLPQEFLFTDYAPLNDWLDTAVRVHMTKVPLSEVFQEPALAGLNHRLSDMPVYEEEEEEPLITIDELALTRRQLLWAIGQDYKLAMVPKFDPLGGTSYIDIRSKE